MKIPRFSKNQWITIVGIFIPAILSILALIKVTRLEVQVSPVIEMKPQIVNVINNITAVKKEIANLQDILHQADNLRISETFRQKDLDIRVKLIENNVDNSDFKAGFLFIELTKFPLKNSVIVSSGNHTFSPSTYEIFHNIVRVACLRTCNVLKEPVEFINVSYLPASISDKNLYTVKDMTYEFGDKVKFNFKPVKIVQEETSTSSTSAGN